MLSLYKLQVEEKRLLELAAKDEERQDHENMRQLVQCLAENEAAAQASRQNTLQEVKHMLDVQKIQPKNNAPREGGLDLSACGPASLQVLSGEDHAHQMRIKAQQEQVKLWCAQDSISKKMAQDEERKAEEEHAAYVLEQDRLRCSLEEEARLKREEEARLRQLENLEYARQTQERKMKEIEDEKQAQKLQSQYLQTCPLLTEDTNMAVNRPDHFKGYEKDTRNQLWAENDCVLLEKQHNIIREKQAEDDWVSYEKHILNQMRNNEVLKQKRRDEENRLHREILAQQRAELQQRRLQEKAESLPAIDGQFFKGFGQSCR